MEAVRTRPPRRSPRPPSLQETPSAPPLAVPESRVSYSVSDTEVLDEDMLSELKTFQQTVLQREALLTTKGNKIASQKAKAKGDIKTLFDQLHELLERREVELNAKVENGYEDIEFEVEEKIGKLYNIRDPVETMLDKCKFKIGNVTNDMVRTLCTETKEKVQAIEEADADIPDFIVNLDAKTKIEEMIFGRFSNEEEHIPEEASQENDNYAPESTDIAVVSGNDSTQFPLSYLEAPDDVFDDVENGQFGHSRSSDRVSSEHSISNFQGLGSAGSDMAVGSEPSAPPLVLVDCNDPEEDPQEDPPPYWQAVGLAGPEEESQSEEVPSLRTNSYPDPSPVYTEFDANPTCTNNVLEPWHSFPLRRQYDVRKPLYVAMSWDDRRICVADRNNRMVKFFSQNGTLLTEMRISSGEVYDIAYLESFDGEARYMATLPKENALLLLSVFEDHSTKLVKKIVFKKTQRSYYTSLCRGPLSNTLVGAVLVPGNHFTAERPRVEMFDFDGKVIQIYQRTVDYVEFQYPRTVKVYNDSIFVSDWRLNLVAVFHSNGSPIGQYKGTPTYPLVNPLDMDIDCYGNVLIVDGEFPNIHVMSTDGRPVEVVKVPKSGTDRSQPKLIAFDAPTRRLAVVGSNGQVGIFKFMNNYKNIRPGELVLHPQADVSVPPDESLPYVEGMLPTTIANIGRQRSRRAEPHFYL